MRTLRLFEHISLDGVIQSPGSPGEDTDNGYKLGGWTAPYSDPAIGKTVVATHTARFDLVLGRRTYDIWSGYWPKAPKSPLSDNLNAATKYVATHRPETLAWGPAEALEADIAEGVQRIKSSDGPGLILWGSSTLVPVLLAHGLVDEVLLIIYPVLLGEGKRFFAEGSSPRGLALVSSTAASSGVLINTYRPKG